MSSNQTANEDEDGRTQRVKYDTKSHFNVLTQMHGSIWPSVLPHCILNTLNICGIILLDRWYGIDLSYSDKGHTFMSMIVSFLVVTRSSIAYSRFMESRSHLAQVMKSCRELMQYAVTFTRYDNSDAATKWRYMVARKTIVLLRTLVCVLEFPTKGELVWKNKVLTREEQADLKNAVGEDNERSVMYLVMALRKTIGSSFESLDEPLHPNRELKLYAFVSEFVTGYHGLTKLIDTPFPFPLAQMTATFIFIWVYTLPAVLYNDEVAVPALLTIVFFITYGKMILCFELQLYYVIPHGLFGNNDN
jgi:predicted membrane chloride channel (bestrophin family)